MEEYKKKNIDLLLKFEKKIYLLTFQMRKTVTRNGGKHILGIEELINERLTASKQATVK